jgi:hypothetical protein
MRVPNQMGGLFLLFALAAPLEGRGVSQGFRHVLTVTEGGKAVCRLAPLAEAAPAAVQRPGMTVLYSSAGSTWQVEYVGFTPEAQAAFQRAVEIWADLIISPVTIRVRAEFVSLPEGSLGSAGPSTFLTLPQHPNPVIRNSYLPAALRDALAGSDAAPGQPDIEASFNSSFTDWYFGLDGRPPFEKYDFVSVVLHELGHGLGFISSLEQVDPQNNRIEWGLDAQGRPVPYDFLVKDGQDRYLVQDAIQNGSPELAAAVTSQHVFLAGPFAVEAAQGAIPELYAPPEWESGSSIAHLDEYLYAEGNPNTLMTPYIFNGEFQHQVGPITAGVLRDVGWKIQDSLQFAQFADGAGLIQSDVVLTNPSRTAPASGKITFYGLDGSELDPADFLVNPAAVQFQIPPLGTITISTKGGQGALAQGSAVAHSDLPVFGVIRFEIKGSGVAGVGSSVPGRAFALPVRKVGALRTGVAIRNNSTREVTVRIRLIGTSGNQVEAKQVQIPGLGRISQFIDELFAAPRNTDFAGTLEVECLEGDIAVLGLELEVGKRFTTLPVARLRE